MRPVKKPNLSNLSKRTYLSTSHTAKLGIARLCIFALALLGLHSLWHQSLDHCSGVEGCLKVLRQLGFAAHGSVDQQGKAVRSRKPLSPEEQRNIAIFRERSPGVVHITSVAVRKNLFSLNVMETPQGTGSGFVWDTYGHIVTNYHVIQGSQKILVAFKNNEIFTARLKGVAPDQDLAVLQVQAPQELLQAIPLGDSTDLLEGQKTYAIGNPFGLDQTFTTGVVSALNREIESISRTPIRGVIQTDAAINQGNSGGPLLDSSGHLIGVNTAIYSPSGDNVGIGFAIPSDTVRWVVHDLIRYGRIARPSIGVEFLPDRIASAFGLKGAVILEVLKSGPAEAIGLKPTRRTQRGDIIWGDRIVALDGRRIHSVQQFRAQIGAFKAGSEVELSISRGWGLQQRTVNARIRLIPD